MFHKLKITEILTFNPSKLSTEIKGTKEMIIETKRQIKSNPILDSLSQPLDKIQIHFDSISKVANNYEEIYKNIILPIKEEGKQGVKQTVKWAIISVILSSIISGILGYFIK